MFIKTIYVKDLFIFHCRFIEDFFNIIINAVLSFVPLYIINTLNWSATHPSFLKKKTI